MADVLGRVSVGRNLGYEGVRVESGEWRVRSDTHTHTHTHTHLSQYIIHGFASLLVSVAEDTHETKNTHLQETHETT